MLSVRNLQSAYGASQVLFDVGLDIGEGEVVTLLGRNGMGKTTTVRSLMGLLAPKGGEISFDGYTDTDSTYDYNPGMMFMRFLCSVIRGVVNQGSSFGKPGYFQASYSPASASVTSASPQR